MSGTELILSISSDDSNDEVDEKDLPSAEECDRRCKEFASISNTDTALAMFFLQERQWNVEKSLQDYFESCEIGNPLEKEKMPFNFDKELFDPKSLTMNSNFEDLEPNRIRLLSWNIDGLDNNNVKTRALSVCQTLIKEKPDVVFLQEVISSNLKVIIEECTLAYAIILGNGRDTPRDNGEYFTALLLRKDTSNYIDHNVIPFYSSIMGRNLLKVQAKVKGLPMVLLTSHLESTAQHENERIKQLKQALNETYEASNDNVAIFGGDLNLRDEELASLGGLKNGFVDIWEDTGKRPEAKFTWDMQKNDNLEMKSRYKPRSRFDRLFYKKNNIIKAVYFELIGFERIASCRRFPSDHWGIMAHFDKISS